MENEDKVGKLEGKLDIGKFIDTCFSHMSAEEFLRLKRDEISKYNPIHLDAVYTDLNHTDETIRATKIKLANDALNKGCVYVTNLDYAGPCIVATGLKSVKNSGVNK